MYTPHTSSHIKLSLLAAEREGRIAPVVYEEN
jgi:hypothetical protein